MLVAAIQKRSLSKRLGALALMVIAAWYVIYSAPLPLVSAWWKFNQAEWNDPLHKKARIADWLILFKSLVGKSRFEIMEMLGEPP
jgi:hypothetical protein